MNVPKTTILVKLREMKSVRLARAFETKLKAGGTKSSSYRMSRVRSRDTRLELAMKVLLNEIGVSYEFQPSMPGHPDFRISGTRVLVFCDSSFWHGRFKRDREGKTFHQNRGFWMKKIIANRARDKRTNTKLRRQGWTVLRLWDSTILRRPETAMMRVKRALHETQPS